MIKYGLGLSISANLSYNLAEESAFDGGQVPQEVQWVDNEGNPMRTNLGNIIYFNTED